MRAELVVPKGIDMYEAAVEGLARVDELLYKKGKLPSIYAGGVRYQQERTEAWRNVAEVLRDGWGDCEDLAAARVGELRASGEKAAKVIVRRTGPKMVHALVQRANGTIEDPSARLGMRTSTNREKVIIVDDDSDELGADLSDSTEVSWTVERTPSGYRGTVRVPLRMPGREPKALIVKRTTPTAKGKSSAVETALNAAAKVLDNPAVSAIIPGEARFALNLVRSPKARDLANKVLGLFS